MPAAHLKLGQTRKKEGRKTDPHSQIGWPAQRAPGPRLTATDAGGWRCAMGCVGGLPQSSPTPRPREHTFVLLPRIT